MLQLASFLFLGLDDISQKNHAIPIIRCPSSEQQNPPEKIDSFRQISNCDYRKRPSVPQSPRSSACPFSWVPLLHKKNIRLLYCTTLLLSTEHSTKNSLYYYCTVVPRTHSFVLYCITAVLLLYCSVLLCTIHTALSCTDVLLQYYYIQYCRVPGTVLLLYLLPVLYILFCTVLMYRT